MQVKTVEEQLIDIMTELDEKDAMCERYKQFFQITSNNNKKLRGDISRMEEEIGSLLYKTEQLEHEKSLLELEVVEMARERDALKDENEYLKGEVEEIRTELETKKTLD